MRRLLAAAVLACALTSVPMAGVSGEDVAQPLFTVACRNGAVVPWVGGAVQTARVCALEVVALWNAGKLTPIVCDASVHADLSKRFFRVGTKLALVADGSAGHFEVLGVEDGRENPGCGLVAWGKDDVTRPRPRYTALGTAEKAVKVKPASRTDLPSPSTLAARWLERRGVAADDRSPIQISQSLRLTLPSGSVDVLEVQAGTPDESGRFPAEGLLIREAGKPVLDVVVRPARRLKTTRVHFLDAFDVGADGTTEVLLFEQYRDGTGDYLVLSRGPGGWKIALRTGRLERRRYETGIRGTAFGPGPDGPG